MKIITKEESLKKYNGTIEFLRKHHRKLSDEKFAQFSDDAFVFGQEAGKSFTEIFDEIHELLLSDVIPETAQIKERQERVFKMLDEQFDYLSKQTYESGLESEYYKLRGMISAYYFVHDITESEYSEIYDKSYDLYTKMLEELEKKTA